MYNGQTMVANPIALIQIPSQRLFQVAAAAKYLGIHPNSLRKYADLGMVKARRLEGRRVFELVELDRFIASLPCYDGSGERPAISRRQTDGDL